MDKQNIKAIYYAILAAVFYALNMPASKTLLENVPPTKRYLLALIIMLIGTAVVVADTIILHHTHLHTHTIVHTHDGTTHSHTITHSHEHTHFGHQEQQHHTHDTLQPKSDENV